MNIPPVVFYVLGAVLMFFGAVRAYVFGWKPRGAPPLADDLNPDQARTTERRQKDQRRHLMMGLVWVVMGLVLIVSTVSASHRVAP